MLVCLGLVTILRILSQYYFTTIACQPAIYSKDHANSPDIIANTFLKYGAKLSSLCKRVKVHTNSKKTILHVTKVFDKLKGQGQCNEAA